MQARAYTDMFLNGGTHVFEAHKVVVTSSSDYLRRQLETGPTDCRKPTIVIPGVRTEVMAALIQFMYMGEVYEEEAIVKEVQCLGRLLGVK